MYFKFTLVTNFFISKNDFYETDTFTLATAQSRNLHSSKILFGKFYIGDIFLANR